MASSSITNSIPTITNLLSIKLDRTNYSLWLAQIIPTLRSRNLMSFVDGTNKCPECFLKDKEGKITDEINPEYEAWILQDQTVLSWINGSLTPSVLATVSRSTSSAATWKALEKRYASQCQNRILQLRSELLRTMRGDLSISDFLDKINGVVDNLALAGNPVSDTDLVSIIMNNVGSVYETTVSSTQARDTPITYDALEALLLSAERRLQNQNVLGVDTGATALHASRSHGGGRGRGTYSSGGRGMSTRGGASFARHPSSSFNGGRGVPRTSSILGPGPSTGMPSSNSSMNRIQCQICSKGGHSALDCYNRMNLAFEGRVPTKRHSAMAAQLTDHFDNSTWLLDTGANSHITTDVGNLENPQAYNGSDSVGGVVDGSGSRDGEDAFAGKM